MGALFGQREKRQWTPEPPIPPFPGTNPFGQPSFAASPEAALTVPTVWACVLLLANTVSQLPLETFRRTANVPARITDPQLITSPSAGETQSEWLHMLMVSLLLRGNAYALIVSRDRLGRPTQLMILNPDTVRVTVDRETGQVTYKLGSSMVDRSNDIWHVRGMTLPGQKIGLSPIAYAASTLGVDLAARKFASDFYDGGGLPKGKMKSDQAINQEQAVTLKERLRAATLNREPVILGQGVDYDTLPVRAEESQFLATQKFNISQIARFYLIPAEKVGGETGSSLTYTTAEMNNINFLTDGVGWWLKRIEDAIFPLLADPQFVKFNTRALLRTDAETSAKVDAIRVASKVMPPSRILAQMNEPPLTDAEKKELELVPLAVTPSTGAPKALPNPPTPATYDDAPDLSPKPKLEAVP